jgi:hypothetical protein
MEEISPFLVKFAIKRSPTNPLPGHYSEKRSLTVIKLKNEYIPLIEAGTQLAELLTKTKVDRESDDNDIGSLPELMTKTFIERERDDDLSSIIKETLTKTEVERERDE